MGCAYSQMYESGNNNSDNRYGDEDNEQDSPTTQSNAAAGSVQVVACNDLFYLGSIINQSVQVVAYNDFIYPGEKPEEFGGFVLCRTKSGCVYVNGPCFTQYATRETLEIGMREGNVFLMRGTAEAMDKSLRVRPLKSKPGWYRCKIFQDVYVQNFTCNGNNFVRIGQVHKGSETFIVIVEHEEMMAMASYSIGFLCVLEHGGREFDDAVDRNENNEMDQDFIFNSDGPDGTTDQQMEDNASVVEIIE
jgi:hypothetical protein